jgi:hypothetical protein
MIWRLWWTRSPAPGALARMCPLLGFGGAALYLAVSQLTPWDRFFELALGFAIAVYIVAGIKTGLRNFVLMLATLFFCVAAVELYSLLRVSPVIEISTPGYSGSRVNLGWGPRHTGVFHQKKIDSRTGDVIYDAAYTIDEHLNRQVLSAATGPTIAFFGDSMTFGQGVGDAETLPQAFADATQRRYRVLNFGVPGYGPQQFLRALETDMYSDLLSDSRLFVMLTAPWHVVRTNCAEGFMWHAPRYVLAQGAPIYVGRCQDHWLQQLRRLWTRTAMYEAVLRPVFGGPSAADVDLFAEILIRAGQLARERYGVPTLILYLQNPGYFEQVGKTDTEIERRMRDAGLIVVEASLDAKDFPRQNLIIPRDGHPTGVANRARALIVRDVVAGLLGSAH